MSWEFLLASWALNATVIFSIKGTYREAKYWLTLVAFVAATIVRDHYLVLDKLKG